ncbi:MAG: ABC transporter ATP-binding protein, partial [Terriglobia bacterium]
MQHGILHAVNKISFTLERGETLAIVGESGSGKSLTSLALMNLLPRLARRSATRLAFDGVDLQAADKRLMRKLRGNRMAMIFQEPMTSLNPVYTIGSQLIEALRCHETVSATVARDRAIQLLERVGIAGAGRRLKQYPHQLSGGLRQRVMIAMALMCNPDVIIADEPTTALDVTIQAQILDLLAGLRSRFELSMLFISHDLAVVSKVANRVAVMYA